MPRVSPNARLIRQEGYVYKERKTGKYFFQLTLPDGKRKTSVLQKQDDSGNKFNITAESDITPAVLAAAKERILQRETRAQAIILRAQEELARQAEAEQLALERQRTMPPLSLLEVIPSYCRLLTSNPNPPSTSTARNNIRWMQACLQWLHEQYPTLEFYDDIPEEAPLRYWQHLQSLHYADSTMQQKRKALIHITEKLIQANILHITNNIWKQLPDVRNVVNTPRAQFTFSDSLHVLRQFSRIRIRDWDEIRVMFAIGTFTGARWGDCCTMRWSHIQIENNRPFFVFMPRKTLRQRIQVKIAICPALGGYLAIARQWQEQNNNAEDYILPHIAVRYLTPSTRCPLGDDVIKVFQFCGYETTQRQRYNDSDRRVNLVGFHSLRGACFSRLIEKGISFTQLKEISGDSADTLSKHYFRVESSQSHIQQSRALMDGIMQSGYVTVMGNDSPISESIESLRQELNAFINQAELPVLQKLKRVQEYIEMGEPPLFSPAEPETPPSVIELPIEESMPSPELRELRPTKEALSNLINHYSNRQIAAIYRLSDTYIRRYLERFGLIRTIRKCHTLSDQELENIRQQIATNRIEEGTANE